MNPANYAKTYFEKLNHGLTEVNLQDFEGVVGTLGRAIDEGRQIFIFGNGGSASTASHFANDLNKLASMGRGKKIKAIALTDNVPLITAWGNDDDFSKIFSMQLDNLLNEGDVLLAITGSGNSANVVEALELGRQRNAKLIAFLGFDGGKIKDMVDHYLLFEEKHYGRVEAVHLLFVQIVAEYLGGFEP